MNNSIKVNSESSLSGMLNCLPTTITQPDTAGWSAWVSSIIPINYNITHQNENVRVDIVAPGLNKESIEVTYNPNNRTLVLKGAKRDGVSFTAQNELPSVVQIYKDVDHANATANYEDGILTILLPYKVDLRVSRINVR